VNLIRTSLATLLVAAAATTTIAAVTKLSDKFTSSTLSSLWSAYADGDTTMSPSGGALNANAAGPGTAAVVIEGYLLNSGSWKASVAARQVLAASALDGESSIHAFMGLQYGPIVDGVDLGDQANGYLIGADIYSDAAYVGWSERQDGVDVDGDEMETSNARPLAGNIVVTYTSTKDRLVIQAGRYKQTFSMFLGSSAFVDDANVYLGAQAEGGATGRIFTFDNFALSGAGVASAQ